MRLSEKPLSVFQIASETPLDVVSSARQRHKDALDSVMR